MANLFSFAESLTWALASRVFQFFFSPAETALHGADIVHVINALSAETTMGGILYL